MNSDGFRWIPMIFNDLKWKNGLKGYFCSNLDQKSNFVTFSISVVSLDISKNEISIGRMNIFTWVSFPFLEDDVAMV